MKHVLGVDGGGTKTLARLCRVEANGILTPIGVGQAAGSNPLSVGWEASQANLSQAIRSACSDTAPEAAVLAVAGCGTADARDQLEQWARKQGFAAQLRVVPDTEPLLADVAPSEAAIGLIAGTGSSAVARHADGRTEILGGWGYLIGDGGSGYAIGEAALRWLTSVYDSPAGVATPFARQLLERLGLNDPPELRTALYRAEDARAWVARLAPTVLDAVDAGDGSANVIVSSAAGDLAGLVYAAADRIEADSRPPVRFAGALLTQASAYRAKVVENLTLNGWSEDRLADAPEAATACARIAAKPL